MSHKARARAQPEGLKRAKPGAGGGRFFRVGVRPKDGFVAFRTQDVGSKGHVERVAGRKASGRWATVTWLISKRDAHVEGERLVGDTSDAKDILATLGSPAHWVSGDRFVAKDRRNIPEREKPTPAMRRAQASNIKKAQAARRRH